MGQVSLSLSAKVRVTDELDCERDELIDKVREAMLPVLRRHGYDIPGVADLCAIEALRAVLREAIIVSACTVPTDMVFGEDTKTRASCRARFDAPLTFGRR